MIAFIFEPKNIFFLFCFIIRDLSRYHLYMGLVTFGERLRNWVGGGGRGRCLLVTELKKNKQTNKQTKKRI